MAAAAADASSDAAFMARAIELAAGVRRGTSPNPWVGALVVVNGEIVAEGSTAPPGGSHAEASALRAAGPAARGATCYVTLEPCAHVGRTPPCADALVEAGVSRVVVALEDPDPRVGGRGIEHLRRAGIAVDVGVGGRVAAEQLAPYLHQRRTGRPFVVLKLAMSLDGRIAAPDGSSRWITGEAARLDVHELRADSDALLVGAGTVRADDPALTVRLPERPGRGWRDQPLRVVLGNAPVGARTRPCLELGGELGDVLVELGGRGVLQLLVEGGAGVAHEFHAAGLVDRYVFYFAPALLGGDDGRAAFAGAGAKRLEDAWRGEIRDVRRVGADLRVEIGPTPS